MGQEGIDTLSLLPWVASVFLAAEATARVLITTCTVKDV